MTYEIGQSVYVVGNGVWEGYGHVMSKPFNSGHGELSVLVMMKTGGQKGDSGGFPLDELIPAPTISLHWRLP